MTDHGPQDDRLRPTAIAQRLAGHFLTELSASGVIATRYSWSVVGGIGITIRNGTRKVYVEFHNDGRIYALQCDRSSEPEAARVESLTTLAAATQEYLYDH